MTLSSPPRVMEGGEYTPIKCDRCDKILHYEQPMELNLKIGSLGSVRTTTLRAFTEEEIAKMIDFKW